MKSVPSNSQGPPTGPAAPAHAYVLGLSMVKNEEDVIEAFVRHNLQFLDALFVADNGSADETRAILVKLEQEGLPLVVFDDPIASYLQSEKMTRFLAGIGTAMFPDFVVPLDADEFIRCESRAAFLEQLQRIPPGGVGQVPWVSYVITPDEAALDGEDPLRLMNHRRREERPTWEKAILRLERVPSPSLILGQGNHGAVRSDGKALRSVKLPAVSLAHFPVRSSEQLTTKAIVGWMACTVRDRHARQSQTCYQWRDAFDLVLERGEIPRGELPGRSMLYAQEQRPIDWDRDVVHDPMPFSYARRYSGGARGRVLATVARSWERSLAPVDTFTEHLEQLIAEKRSALKHAGGSKGKAGATAFEVLWHLDHPFADIAPFRYLAERFRPRSVLDVGCGLGATLLWFQSAGIAEVRGVDGFPAGDALLPEELYAKHDIAQPFEAGGPYDLVICTEVVEHLPPEGASVLLATLARHAKDLILFSAAEEGQPGADHINCRPIGFWLEQWRALGWVPDRFCSLAFRSLATLSWLRRNSLLLVRADAQRPREPRPGRDLATIGTLRYRWYPQDRKIFEYPFTVVPPEGVYSDGSPARGLIRRAIGQCSDLLADSWRKNPPRR